MKRKKKSGISFENSTLIKVHKTDKYDSDNDNSSSDEKVSGSSSILRSGSVSNKS